jgi:hypothetical protein
LQQHGEVAERHVGSWVRLVLVLVAVLVVCFPVLAAIAFLEFAGARFGWIPSVLLFGALGFGAAQLAVAAHWKRARRRAAVALAMVGVLFGVAVAHFAPATPGRLRHEIQELVQPGWRLREDVTSGNALCFDYCTSVSRTYVVSAHSEAVLDSLRPVLARHGLSPAPAVDRDRSAFVNRHGDVDIELEVAPDGPRRTLVYINAEAT